MMEAVVKQSPLFFVFLIILWMDFFGMDVQSFSLLRYCFCIFSFQLSFNNAKNNAQNIEIPTFCATFATVLYIM